MSSAAALRQRKPIDVQVTDKSSTVADPYDESDLPGFTPPPFTIKELLGAIPAHCFERSALRSSLYVVSDLTQLAVLMYAASFIDPAFGKAGSVLQGTEGLVAKWALWSAYWVAAGFVGTGVWILGHECGHQAFSTSKTINNAMGLFLHSLVLVPYHSWRISHGKHHAATGHMDRDEVFVPNTRAEQGIPKHGDASIKKTRRNGLELDHLLEDAPLFRLFWAVLQQLFGWPLYLFTNVAGRKSYPKGTNHFLPSSAVFSPHQANDILISDAALLAMGAALNFVAKNYGGWSTVVKFYFIPYLFVNHWLVFITFLQHTDPELPHYRAADWNFQRGALATKDREMFGFIGPYVLHGIAETHVAHHLCSKIPHYHAWDATEALKKVLGDHYQSSTENMFVSFWKSYNACRFVEDEGNTVFFRDSFGRSQMKVVYGPADDSGVDVQGGEEVAEESD